MSSSIDKALYHAASKILEPLARLFVGHGVAYGMFEQLVRDAFVKAGSHEMEKSGRRPTVSGISALTGLSRKAVKQLQESDVSEESASRLRYNRAVRVISGWMNDPRFQTEGSPAILPIDGSAQSFSELVREHSGDVPSVALLKVLQESGNVVVTDGRVKLVKHAYVPTNTEPDTLNILGVDVAELITTISINIDAAHDERLFQRKVSTAFLDRNELAAFREYSNKRSQQLLEEYDGWLSSREVDTDKRNSKHAAYVAVGVYYSELAN